MGVAASEGFGIITGIFVGVAFFLAIVISFYVRKSTKDVSQKSDNFR